MSRGQINHNRKMIVKWASRRCAYAGSGERRRPKACRVVVACQEPFAVRAEEGMLSRRQERAEPFAGGGIPELGHAGAHREDDFAVGADGLPQ